MSQDNAIFIQLCKQLYPNEYRNNATREATEFPFHVEEKIHSYRDIDDLEVNFDAVKSLLGYTLDDKRNNILDRLIIHCDHSGIISSNPTIGSDKQIMKVAIAKNPHCLVIADTTLQDDDEFVMLALRSGETLCTVSERLRNDKRFVRFAVSSAGPLALQYASNRLQKDPELIMEAESHPNATEMRNHPNFDYPAAYAADEMFADLILALRFK